MPYPGKRKTRKVRRLKDVEPFEVAIVPKGANGGYFVVLKEDMRMKFDSAKLAEAHTTLGKIVTVCKSGTPTQEAATALTNDLQAVMASLSSLVEPEDGKKLREGAQGTLDEIKSTVSGLEGATYDLNVQDHLEALSKQIKALDEQIAALPSTPAAPAANTQTQGEPTQAATVEPQTGVAAQQTQDNPTVAAPEPGPEDTAGANNNQNAAASASDAAAANAEPATGADATGADSSTEGAAEGETKDTVTKADLTAFGTELVTVLKEGLKDFASAIQTQSAPQAVRTAAAPDPLTAAQSFQDDESYWGNILDMNADD